MRVIDISNRIFTKQDRNELCIILRTLSKKNESTETEDLTDRANFLLRKAGGSEKFFKNEPELLKEIL